MAREAVFRHSGRKRAARMHIDIRREGDGPRQNVRIDKRGDDPGPRAHLKHHRGTVGGGKG